MLVRGLFQGIPRDSADFTFLALADADPLGVNTNISFDDVGGLEDRE